MDLYCRRGLLDHHLQPRAGDLRLPPGRDASGSQRSFRRRCALDGPRGGLTLWVSLPAGLTRPRPVGAGAARRGRFHAGARILPFRGGNGHFRLSYIRETEERIQSGIARLGALVRANLARGAAPSAAGPFI